MLPDKSDLVSLAPEIKISYVGARAAGSVMELTAGLKMELTHHFTDEEVQPGKVDVVLVPGPDPRENCMILAPSLHLYPFFFLFLFFFLLDILAPLIRGRKI